MVCIKVNTAMGNENLQLLLCVDLVASLQLRIG